MTSGAAIQPASTLISAARSLAESGTGHNEIVRFTVRGRGRDPRRREVLDAGGRLDQRGPIRAVARLQLEHGGDGPSRTGVPITGSVMAVAGALRGPGPK